MSEFKCQWSDEEKSLIQITVNSDRSRIVSEYSLIELTPLQALILKDNLNELLTIKFYECPGCGKDSITEFNGFCPSCGTKVEWVKNGE